ncbi:MAG TPA: DUF4232 domain-containing protein [Candidatus Limnocylindrales bacterium]
MSVAIAQATVDFGDGTTGLVSQGCASASPTLTAHHVYRVAGHLMLAVTAASLCEQGWQLNLSRGGDIRVLASASAATAQWPACTTYQLAMSGLVIGAAAGSVGAVIRLTNVSQTGCNLSGYPGLQLVSPTGSLLPTHVRDATQDAALIPAITVARVALGPGDVAAFDVGYGDNPTVDEPYAVACPTARWVRVILPGVGQYGTAQVPLAPCEGGVDVSPIFPGGDWIGPNG